ncbi:hypothetical protein LJC34_07745, partial [Oscillospiraceae bacterium OttesenSCG-928-G22]|nr:hypothetical protein [Oscillospiraceae bacterium OttesenSCG-928-G22]
MGSKKKARILALVLVLGLLASPFAALASTPPVREKDKNTAFITHKSAKWVDEAEYLAELTLRVNGTQISKPLDIVICMDRSGSMDINNIQGDGSHSASCPCLNQDHFYLKPIAIVDETKTDKIYYDQTKDPNDPNNLLSAAELYTAGSPDVLYRSTSSENLIAYNHEAKTFNDEADATKYAYYSQFAGYAEWYELATSDKIHLYHEFPSIRIQIGTDIDNNPIYKQRDGTYIDTYDLAPYHFKMVGGDYVRISKWDPTDPRRLSTPLIKNAGKINETITIREFPGIWIHGDVETQGCMDRFTEVKSALKAFTAAALAAGTDNRVALAPFSLRDSTMPLSLNHLTPNYIDWLIQKRGETGRWLHGMSITTDNGKKVFSGTDAYDSVVDFQDTPDEINNMLDDLFTTANTDYIYGLSQAYNLIAGRADKTRKPVVIFLSDGKPYSTSTQQVPPNSQIGSFANQERFVEAMTEIISNPVGTHVDGALGNLHLWKQTGFFLRNDIDRTYYDSDEEGPPALGVPIVTVGYMVQEDVNIKRLQKMASSPNGYIDIPADGSRMTQNELVENLLHAAVFPGGRNAVLEDEISKYFYVNPSFITGDIVDSGADYTTYQSTKQNIAIRQYTDGREVVLWTIGNIYQYAEVDEPSITVPLVLREPYRTVSKITYYPTNADNPEPPLDNPANGPDGEDTGAKLIYTDPSDVDRYDTI